MKTTEEQRASLARLVEFCTNAVPGKANFGAMLLLSPPGDVSFLAPIAPQLRGVEIVSASAHKADGRNYDIWKWGRKHRRIIKGDLTATEVLRWLMLQGTYTEAQYLQHAEAWTKDLLKFYRIPPKPTHPGGHA